LLPTVIDVVCIRAALLGPAAAPPPGVPAVPPHAASDSAAAAVSVVIEMRIEFMDASSSASYAQVEYRHRLRSALASQGVFLYDVGHMTGRLRFAGIYFYAYLGPARDRLGMG
jgi:hypothetical protein